MENRAGDRGRFVFETGQGKHSHSTSKSIEWLSWSISKTTGCVAALRVRIHLLQILFVVQNPVQGAETLFPLILLATGPRDSFTDDIVFGAHVSVAGWQADLVSW
jgi:hypothetical protein